MPQITPLRFRDAFLKAVASVERDVIALWDARRDYTALMLDIVFPKVATDLRISVYNADYYYLDSVFYSEQDREHFGQSAIYAKCIEVAVEHEHDAAGTAVEMNKLQLFNTPLKVLITYAASPALRAFYLERYAKIVRAADTFNDFATLRRQLVIFGSLSEKTLDWHSYAYESAGFNEF